MKTSRFGFDDYEDRLFNSILAQESSGTPIIVVSDKGGRDSTEIILAYHDIRCAEGRCFAVDGAKELNRVINNIFFSERDMMYCYGEGHEIRGICLLDVQDFGEYSPFREDHSLWDHYIRHLLSLLDDRGYIIIHYRRPEDNPDLQLPPFPWQTPDNEQNKVGTHGSCVRPSATKESSESTEFSKSSDCSEPSAPSEFSEPSESSDCSAPSDSSDSSESSEFSEFSEFSMISKGSYSSRYFHLPNAPP